MLLVDALYVNNSGGKVLLDYLINSLLAKNVDVFFLLDKRCESSYLDLNLKNVTFVDATLKNRKEFYRNDNKKFTCIFCFANLAPPVKCSGKVFTYFHNLLLSEIPAGTPLKKRILLLLKRYLAFKLSFNSDHFLVQTEYARTSFLKAFGRKNVQVLPFYNDFGIQPGTKAPKTFLYVSDGNPHKNHINLFKAWQLLADRQAELWVTISDNYGSLQQEVVRLQEQGLKVFNFKNLDRSSLNGLYAKAAYMIYPSLLESFGLGLIEGALAGCQVLASDLPFAYQVVDPSAVFDAQDPESISLCISSAIEGQIVTKTALKATNEIEGLITILANEN